jgi:exosome complex RNA-binding protein Rrp4
LRGDIRFKEITGDGTGLEIVLHGCSIVTNINGWVWTERERREEREREERERM